MSVTIIKPRLDLTFKKSLNYSVDLNPLRKQWDLFIQNIISAYKKKLIETRVIEIPLWLLKPTFLNHLTGDIFFIPHRERKFFQSYKKCFFYMQQVIPNLFTLDVQGWCGGASWKDSDLTYNCHLNKINYYDKISSLYRNSNISKFEQPVIKNNLNIPENYILVPLQIPDDYTIINHSNVGVGEFITKLVNWADKKNINLVFKGHPVNKMKMQKFKSYILSKTKHTWVEDVSIVQLIKNADCVFVINSGTGLESMIYGKQVFCFGEADYSQACVKGSINNMKAIEEELYKEVKIKKYKNFINNWYNKYCYDNDKTETFEKIPIC